MSPETRTYAEVLSDVVRRLDERGISASLAYPKIVVIDPDDARVRYKFGITVSLAWDTGTSRGETSVPYDCQDEQRIAEAILKVVKK